VERVVAESRADLDPREALEAGLAAALRGARDHPLLDRLVTTDRGWPAQAHPSGMTVEPL